MRQINCQIESAELFNRERIERSESFFCEWLLRKIYLPTNNVAIKLLYNKEEYL